MNGLLDNPTAKPELTDAPDITVYTKPNCTQCVSVKAVLDANNIPYRESPIDDDAMAIAERMNYKSAPIVVDTSHPEGWSFCGYNLAALKVITDVE